MSAAPHRTNMPLKTGFHFGRSDDGWMWLRSPEGRYKKVDVLIVEALFHLNTLGIDWRDKRSTLSVPQRQALDTLAAS